MTKKKFLPNKEPKYDINPEGSLLENFGSTGLIVTALICILLFLAYLNTPDNLKIDFIVCCKDAIHEHQMIATISIAVLSFFSHFFLIRKCKDEKLRLEQEKIELQKLLSTKK